jgi:serine/threonine-protein kinase RsbW
MKQTFPAKLAHLPAMLSWITTSIKEFDAKSLSKIELASEEALVNIIQHAKQETLEIHLKSFPGHVEILIKDKGPAFNPLEIPAKTFEEMPLEERPLGGLGIHLMRSCVDEVRYTREGNTNLLSLIKKRT